ncbi:stress-induced-phosphoprotein 1-like isoform X2 [Brachionichthys hirsutus]|uniref:stress-induced-phosphoprotein 1-like isoform X2 n=1 Tax=Brachionichthys hirsutus TaxID=412623 RepID=UPI0036053D1A
MEFDFGDETDCNAFFRSLKFLPVPVPADIPQMLKLGYITHIDRGSDLDVSDEDDYDYDSYTHGFHGRSWNSRSSRDEGLNRSRPTEYGFARQPPLYYAPGGRRVPHSRSTVQDEESDTERKARLLEEAKKSKEKAEKKRLKKQKQKERKQLEKLKKEKDNPLKSEERKEEERKVLDATDSNVSAKDTDSSDGGEDEASDEEDDRYDGDEPEELDVTSPFVSRAALIAKRKLEQRPKPERKEREVVKAIMERPKDVEEEDSAASSFQDNKKISTKLASIGYRFANAGDFNMAIKYFTDAIKYNPTEFKLFGNRAYCFERLQEYTKALTDAELSLSMSPGWVKGLFRKGRALAGLKRHEEAAQAFTDVLKLDASCTEAAQELMRVQITQLMEHGFSREHSSNALIIHGTVKKAVEVLCKLNGQPAIQNGTRPPVQVANASGVSPVLSASINLPLPLPRPRDAAEAQFKNGPAGPVQIVSDVKSRELFPVWVGNLDYPTTETALTNLFAKVGLVHSMNMLTHKRCAFVNFTQREHCEEAIRRFHGFILNGTRLAVRYPDRIPPGRGISRSALTSDDLEDIGRSAAAARRPFPLSTFLSHPRGES